MRFQVPLFLLEAVLKDRFVWLKETYPYLRHPINLRGNLEIDTEDTKAGRPRRRNRRKLLSYRFMLVFEGVRSEKPTVGKSSNF